MTNLAYLIGYIIPLILIILTQIIIYMLVAHSYKKYIVLRKKEMLTQLIIFCICILANYVHLFRISNSIWIIFFI